MSDDPKRNLLVIFKDGPNHGFIFKGQEAAAVLFPGDWESVPKVGAGVQIPAYWSMKPMLEQIPRERTNEAWAKIGITESRMYIYRVASIEDDVLVYQYESEG